jgi:starch-binding outer membrane protein, SusD/RagB family
MNKKNHYKIVMTTVLLAFLFSSCEEYLDKAPSSALPESKVFSDPRLFKEYAVGIYPYLWYSPDGNWATYSFGGFCSLQMACIEDATDLSDGARVDAGPRTGLNIGNWFFGSGNQAEVEWPWTGAYKAIRICNRILDNVDIIEGLADNERNEIKGQALFFRAFFHFEMVKRYGGIPYISKTLNSADDMDLVRDSYDDCIQKICDDYDAAAELLPLNFAESEFGRPEKGAAMALKARALLFAASPLNNVANDTEKWKKAAQAAYTVIQLGRYSLVPKERYQNIFYGVPYTEETIFCRNGGPGGYGGGS